MNDSRIECVKWNGKRKRRCLKKKKIVVEYEETMAAHNEIG